MPISRDDFHPQLDRRQIGELTKLIGELGHFRGHWRKLQEIRAERLVQLRQVTTIESTGSSTRIEGAALSDAEVSQVLSGLRIDSFRARDEAEVRGYGELLTTIFESHAAIPLTENHLKQLHGMLLRYSTRDEWHRGEYKTNPNDVVLKEGHQIKQVLFETASPFDTPHLMTELVRATNEALADSSLDPLVVIARFVVDFLAVHPFQDGNGRLARALTVLLLLRAGYDYVPYASLERIIEENKKAYYDALRTSQLAMRTDPAGFGDWLLFFLNALRAQQRALEAKLKVERELAELSSVQQQISDFIATRGRVTSREITLALAISPRAVRYHLEILISRGIIDARGHNKGRFYTPSGRSEAPRPSSPLIGTNAIIAEILRRGGHISRTDLISLVRQHGYDPRTVGVLHGRRLAHLRRDPQTKESILTSRGEEVARQFLFAERLSRRPTDDGGTEGNQPAG
ncbi:MAG: Fic family protein [Gemmatimonadetes bacterium]|nr:Fic family protein [Gemmatimonadota bacterium]